MSWAEASWARSVSEERNATLPGPEELSSWSLWSLVWWGMVARSSLARSRKLMRRGHQLVVSTLGGGGGGGGGQRAWRSDKGCRRLKRDDEGTSCVEPSSPATAKEECKGAMSSRRVTIHGLKVDGVGPAARRRTTEGRMPTGGGDSALGQEAGGEQGVRGAPEAAKALLA